MSLGAEQGDQGQGLGRERPHTKAWAVSILQTFCETLMASPVSWGVRPILGVRKRRLHIQQLSKFPGLVEPQNWQTTELQGVLLELDSASPTRASLG